MKNEALEAQVTSPSFQVSKAETRTGSKQNKQKRKWEKKNQKESETERWRQGELYPSLLGTAGPLRDTASVILTIDLAGSKIK